MLDVMDLVPAKSRDRMFSIVRQSKGFFVLLHGGSSFLREGSARTLAREYLCTGTRNENCPCASCIKGLENPDLFFKGPSISGNLLAGSTKEAIEFLETSSILSGKKCVVLLGVDTLTKDALGNLLQILEKNSSYYSIIMTAKSLNKVANTLKSRCHIIFTGDKTKKSLFSRLIDSGTGVNSAEEISRSGSVNEADPCLDMDLFKSAHKSSVMIIGNIFRNNFKSSLKYFEEYSLGINDLKLQSLIDDMIATFNDILLVQLGVPTKIMAPSRLEWYNEILSKGIPEWFLAKAMSKLKQVSLYPTMIKKSMFIWALVGINYMLISAPQSVFVETKEKPE